jgi:tRNA (cmo5U34)-methyltransferase
MDHRLKDTCLEKSSGFHPVRERDGLPTACELRRDWHLCYAEKWSFSDRITAMETSDEPQSIQEYYETLVKGYDDLSEKIVMRNTDLQRSLIDAIPFTESEKIRVLDLGIGTGLDAVRILEKLPHSSLVGIDFSDGMIRCSTQRLAPFTDRVTLVQQDMAEANLATLGNFDLVISGVTIHNLPHTLKDPLFRKIYACLCERGAFVNGDFIEAETPEENVQFRTKYREFLETNLREEELAKWLQHALEFDMPMKLSEQRNRLEEVGFKDWKVTWSYLNEATYVTRK